MATNTTDDASAREKKDHSMAIAVVLPSLFAIVLVLLLVITFLGPRITNRESAASKEDRKKKRMEKLDETVKALKYAEWSSKQKPETILPTNPLCVICLDEIDNDTQIRPLTCQHIFHQSCLDDWYGRWNEYCPLCHRAIIPGTKEKKDKLPEPPPVAFLV